MWLWFCGGKTMRGLLMLNSCYWKEFKYKVIHAKGFREPKIDAILQTRNEHKETCIALSHLLSTSHYTNAIIFSYIQPRLEQTSGSWTRFLYITNTIIFLYTLLKEVSGVCFNILRFYLQRRQVYVKEESTTQQNTTPEFLIILTSKHTSLLIISVTMEMIIVWTNVFLELSCIQHRLQCIMGLIVWFV